MAPPHFNALWPAQDRAVIVPAVFNRDDICFLGVFDGTVGDHAADYVHTTIADAVVSSPVRVTAACFLWGGAAATCGSRIR